jgi:hypothetical protein
MSKYADSVMTLPKALKQRDEARAQVAQLVEVIEKMKRESAGYDARKYKLVPIEMTLEMIEAWLRGKDFQDGWKGALDAAPSIAEKREDHAD